MIDSLIGLFTKPIWWALGWFPHVGRIHRYDRAVRVSGPKVSVIEPGWYWWVPNIQDILSDNVVRKARALDKQTLTTKDGYVVRVGAVLVFKVTDIVKWLIENEDPDNSLLVEAERCVRFYVESNEYEDLLEASKELTYIATSELAEAFGVRVERLAMTDFATTRALDHSGISLSISQPEVN